MLKRILGTMMLAMVPAAMCVAQVQQPAAPQPQADVPVKNVVLFSSGVGYFEHAGTVRGDGLTELRFKTNQINDILKSLVLQDLDGGRVSTIQYPSQDPISKTLRSFQVDITNNPPLADLLNQLRGAKVTVAAQAEKLTGTILGVEKKMRPMGEKETPVEVAVLNILTGASIRSIDMNSITNLSLDDPQLQNELTKALTSLAQARDQDKKPVTINFRGDGERRVRIGYVVETPIWKTSYRLILDDKAGKLQGWAIVENQTESDWDNVSLSLVSGRPISFVMDLYQPLYVPRPVVVPELFASLRPQVYDDALAQSKEMLAFEPRQLQAGAEGFGGGGGGGGRGGRGGRGGGASGNAPAPPGAPMAARSFARDVADSPAERMGDVTASVQSVASAARIGELFQYTVGNVMLPRQKSAMLPIVTDSVEVERLSIYNGSVLPKNPLNGARLKNTTGKHLLQGPITVLDDNSYAGDAQIDNLPPGQERLLSYGVDLQMLVDNTKNTTTSAITTGRINKGVLSILRKHQSTQDYIADNKSEKNKTLIVEHPIRQGWKLVDTQTPIETTQALYRFKGDVPAGKSTKLTIKEEVVQGESMAILPADIGQILLYSRTGEIPAGVREALTKAIQLKQAMVDTDRQINEKTQQLTAITEEQGRIRQNMQTVERTGQYYARLLAKLNEQESNIEKLQTDRETLIKQRDTQRKALEDYLSDLNVG